MMVDKWCALEWLEMHTVCRERCLMMPSVPHHQGSRSLSGYAQTWVREFIYYSKAQFCMISNHLPVFLAIVVTWWPALL
jgi:hypothetical protein